MKPAPDRATLAAGQPGAGLARAAGQPGASLARAAAPQPGARWTTRYLALVYRDHGRSWAGVDCWGLARLVLAEERGWQLPDLGELYRQAADPAQAAEALATGLPLLPLRPLASGEEAVAFDLLLFRRAGRPWHVGVVVEAGRMLHVEDRLGVRLESYRGPAWSRRLEGIWRHVG